MLLRYGPSSNLSDGVSRRTIRTRRSFSRHTSSGAATCSPSSMECSHSSYSTGAADCSGEHGTRRGFKPLYVSSQGNRFAFASELKSFSRLKWLRPSQERIDHDALSHYLALQFIPAPYTIYRDIEKLPAGHAFEYALDDRRLTVKQYWSPPPPSIDKPPTRAEAVVLVRETFRASVKSWATSDVPIRL